MDKFVKLLFLMGFLVVLPFGVAQKNERFFDWNYYNYTLWDLIITREVDYFDDPILLEFGCKDDVLYSELKGVEDALFEDADDIAVRVSTESEVRQIKLTSSEAADDLVIDPNPSNLKMWIDAVAEEHNRFLSDGLKVEITTGYLKRVHTFEVYGFEDAFDRLSCSADFTNSLESWQLDQAVGNHWYVEDGFVYTNDPEENNPGSMFVIPRANGTYDIAIVPDLNFANDGSTTVRYSFNEELENSDAQFERWSIVEIEEGSTILMAPQRFVNEFAAYSRDDGFVEVEMTGNFEGVAHRTFILDGFTEAFDTLLSD